jgi:coenzyme PQQ precursor peptide PqqA
MDARLRCASGRHSLGLVRHLRRKLGDMKMAWKAPKIVEVPVGMEINMYACAARK